MGDETQADYDAYRASIPKAPVIWLKRCKNCEGSGQLRATEPSGKSFVFRCHCICDFNCPQCGKKHGRPYFATVVEFLHRCYVCGWSYKQVDHGEKAENVSIQN